MTYTQTRDANWKVPYVGGWCLKYVQDAFGTDHPYASAIDAWNANFGGGNHPGELPPAGRTVGVYFSLGNVPAGHVAIYLDDGTVASSTQAGSHTQGFLHPNLQNLISVYGQYNGGCTYLGWSEFVGTVRVVTPIQPVSQPSQGGEDMIDQGTLTQLFQLILGREPDAGAVSHYVGHYSTSFVVGDLLASSEHAQHAAALAAQISGLQSQITDLQSQLTTEQTKDTGLVSNLADLTSQLDTTNKALADKTVSLAADEAKIADLSTQLETLKAQADKPPVETPTATVAPKPASNPPTPVQPKLTGPQTFAAWLVSLFKGSK
jgi:hypothetical protein